MPCASTRRSSATLAAGSSTGLPNRLSTTIARGAPASYEGLGEPWVLGGLRQTSQAGPRSRRQELRPTKRESAAPFIAIQKSRAVLVGAYRVTLSCARNRSRRQSRLVLDRVACRLRRYARMSKRRAERSEAKSTRHDGDD